jgi:hypothetical protein
VRSALDAPPVPGLPHVASAFKFLPSPVPTMSYNSSAMVDLPSLLAGQCIAPPPSVAAAVGWLSGGAIGGGAISFATVLLAQRMSWLLPKAA